MACAARMERFEASDLYVVITGEFCAGRSTLDVLAEVLDAGVTLVQLREKDLHARDLYHHAVMFRELTAEAGALLIINDRVDVAMAAGADGVHLGQDDLPIDAARQAAPDLIIGASTHSLAQALAAQAAGADYLNIGPIFPTATKTTAMDPLGPEAIAEIRPYLTVPFSCMGGIKAENINQVLELGARHPAVVTAVTAAPDVQAAAAALRDQILAAREA